MVLGNADLANAFPEVLGTPVLVESLVAGLAPKAGVELCEGAVADAIGAA